MTKREKLTAVAFCILSAQAGQAQDASKPTAGPTTPAAKEATQKPADAKPAESKVECFGAKAKGNESCAVTQEQIDLANKVFKNAYAKSTPHECGGDPLKKGILGWISKPDAKKCFAAGGFIFEKDASGALTIRDKSGVKKS